MCAPTVAHSAADALHARFLTLLPKIEWCVAVYFRDVRCADRKQDCIAEAVALAWAWYCRLAQRGKDAADFITVLAGFAARAVACGRRVCGQERARDVLSPVAQRKYGFRVEPLPTSTRVPIEQLYATPRGQERLDALEDCLRDNTQSAVIDQVVFRLDFPAWRRTRTDRDRRVIDDLMIGSRTQEVAEKYGLTASRISQFRRAFFEDWAQFCGDEAEEEHAPVQARRAQ